MTKYIIFYCLGLDYDYVRVDAESLQDAIKTSQSFHRESGAVILSVCPEHLLIAWHYDE